MPEDIKKISKRHWQADLKELKEVAEVVAKEVSKSSPFVLWLRGELGAGKTTFTGELLRALGLPRSTPVLSPTYTFMTEYKTNIGLIAHMDLYRLADNDAEAIDFLLSDRNFAGLIVEWPERALKATALTKTHEIVLAFSDRFDRRDIDFFESARN
jgi:tRNA threonylcarbamoyladenosine biosynthesis protein TsaE